MTRPASPPALSRRRRAAIAAARAGLGTRFRPQGRLPGVGLDCVGVVLLAAAGAGVTLPPLPAYALGGDHDRQLLAGMKALGLRRVRGGRPQAKPGDIVVVRLAAGHCHLGLITEAGVVHAHAGLGRVVEAPLPPEWPVLGCWALPGVR